MAIPGPRGALVSQESPGWIMMGMAYRPFWDALGGSDNDPADAETAIRVGIGTYHDGVSTDDYLTIILRKNLLAQNIVDFQFDVSQDLIMWRGGDAVVFVSETDNGDGTATLTWRSATPVDLSAEEFIRFRVSQNE